MKVNIVCCCRAVLMIVLVLFASCSDKEEVYYYRFKDIQYSMEEGDGVEEYDTPMEIVSVTKNSSPDSDMYSPIFDPYVRNHERYVFMCDAPAEFNPTVGYVHVPVPMSVAGSEIILSEDLNEYSMEETEDVQSVSRFEPVAVPPMTQLTLSGELTMEKMTLTYRAVFVRCPSGEEHIVRGKYIRHRPREARVKKEFEKL